MTLYFIVDLCRNLEYYHMHLRLSTVTVLDTYGQLCIECYRYSFDALRSSPFLISLCSITYDVCNLTFTRACSQNPCECVKSTRGRIVNAVCV